MIGVLMVGLTGGIGSGKSAVAARLAELGAIVVDSDALAREVVAPGTEGLAEVVAAFGPGVLTPDGAMDRAKVAQVVFGDEARRRQLESIIHPRVRDRSDRIVAAASPDAVVVNDIPLLVESGLASMPGDGLPGRARGQFDLVIVVLASEEVRVARLVELRGMSEPEARARIAAQATDEQRRAVADVQIVNEGTLEELIAAVDAVWEQAIRPRVTAG
jgi:dephospho-CoA kinase